MIQFEIVTVGSAHKISIDGKLTNIGWQDDKFAAESMQKIVKMQIHPADITQLLKPEIISAILSEFEKLYSITYEESIKLQNLLEKSI